MNAIEITNLTKSYGTLVAVDHLNLNIQRGELFSQLGVNGAGKSTTIKMLCGLTRPDQGDAILLGNSILTAPAAVKARIGVSPQQTAVAPNLSADENLSLICSIHGFSRAKATERIAAMHQELGLAGISKRKAGKLSGGWQRRLSIAMALISEPQILFLDEPTLGLDVIARAELWDTIRALKDKTTIVLTTHYMEEAEALSDRIGIMKEGRLLTVGTAQQIKDATGNQKFEQAFIDIVRGVKA